MTRIGFPRLRAGYKMKSMRSASRLSITYALMIAAINLTACVTRAPGPVAPPLNAADVGELYPNSGVLKGYLPPAQLPDSLALLPAPPTEGSAALGEDTAVFRSLTALQSSARGQLAVRDADLSYPASISTFSCAVGVPISEADFPNLTMLLRRTMGDAALATYKAKNKYQRTRPFVALSAHTCTPKDEAFLAKDGSYPSGHSAIGWAWALVLTEVVPDREDAILQRGRAFSQSRAICGAHWQSDIEAGRLIGAATVARLHADSVFKAQLEAARTEIAKARARGLVPASDCAAETATIAASAIDSP
jgi:acid phosphatase (class A)